MAERRPERAGEGAEDVEVEAVRSGTLDLSEYVVVDCRAAGAFGKSRQREVDGEEFRQNPFGLRAGKPDRSAPMREVGDGADRDRNERLQPLGQPFLPINNQKAPGREAE